MTGDDPNFADVICGREPRDDCAGWVLQRGGSKARLAAISDGLNVFSRPLSYRQTACITTAETVKLQTAMDLLMLRLRLFGESVQ